MTNEEISKLSDFKLNKAIALAKGWSVRHDNYGTDNKIHILFERGAPYTFDFNNWNDLMLLVVEHMITPSIYANRVTVEDVIYGCEVELDFCEFGRHHECPLEHKEKVTQRALAECLLKALVEKNKTS